MTTPVTAPPETVAMPVAVTPVKVRETPVAVLVAAWERVTVLAAKLIEEIVVLAAMPAPATAMPGVKLPIPTTLLIVVLPETVSAVATMVKVNETPVVAVAACERVTVPAATLIEEIVV